MPLAGGAATAVGANGTKADALKAPTAMVADATALYWLDNCLGVRKLALADIVE